MERLAVGRKRAIKSYITLTAIKVIKFKKEASNLMSTKFQPTNRMVYRYDIQVNV